jgi:class I fructose-bisphosphate aldolase
MTAGLTYRLGRILGRDGRAMILPVDHGLMLGRLPGLEEPAALVADAIDGGCDGLLMSIGLARLTAGLFGGRAAPARVITLDSVLPGAGEDPGAGTLVASVSQAVRLGADAVKLLMPWDTPSAARAETLRRISAVVNQADRWELPVMVEPAALRLPRGEAAVEAELSGARIAMELGAHLLKIAYPGSAPVMRSLIGELKLPTLILGGPQVSSSADVIRLVGEAVAAGASGIVIGRQVWQRHAAERRTLMRVLVGIVHESMTVSDGLAAVA